MSPKRHLLAALALAALGVRVAADPGKDCQRELVSLRAKNDEQDRIIAELMVELSDFSGRLAAVEHGVARDPSSDNSPENQFHSTLPRFLSSSSTCTHTNISASSVETPALKTCTIEATNVAASSTLMVDSCLLYTSPSPRD